LLELTVLNFVDKEDFLVISKTASAASIETDGKSLRNSDKSSPPFM
jgi:hypothetical protein